MTAGPGQGSLHLEMRGQPRPESASVISLGVIDRGLPQPVPHRHGGQFGPRVGLQLGEERGHMRLDRVG